MELDLTLQEAADIEDFWKCSAEDNTRIKKKKSDRRKMQVGSFEIFTVHQTLFWL